MLGQSRYPFSPFLNSLKILDNLQLQLALAKQTREVKWLRSGLPATMIHPQMAMAIVKGGIYTGSTTISGRVKWIREADPRSPFEWRDCWRTTEAAVLQPCTCTGEYE
jgi:hypothetical protein